MDEFRIRLKIIRDSTRKLEFKFEFEIEFGNQIRIRPVEFEFRGPKTVYQNRILSNLPPNNFKMTKKWLFQNINGIFKLKMPIF